MSKLKTAIERARGPEEVKFALNLRAEDSGLDTGNFGGILSSTEDTVQKALDVLDDIFGSAVTITGDITASGGDLIAISTDAGAGVGPELILYRNSASPADNDQLGRVRFDGEDDGGTQVSYAAVEGVILDPTVSAGIEGRLDFYAMDDGTLSKKMALHRGLVVGSPTGDDKGTGTANIVTIYEGGTSLASKYYTRTADYDSGEQTVAVDTLLSLTHSLGGIPSLVEVTLRCKTADRNYAAGDEILMVDTTQTNDGGFVVMRNATKIDIVQGADISVIDKSTFNRGLITTSNWKWVIRAWT